MRPPRPHPPALGPPQLRPHLPEYGCTVGRVRRPPLSRNPTPSVYGGTGRSDRAQLPRNSATLTVKLEQERSARGRSYAVPEGIRAFGIIYDNCQIRGHSG